MTGWDIQGRYSRETGWETVTTETTKKEALTRLREYRENEPEYTHRIVRERS